MVLLVRVFGWSTLSILLVFLINNYLSFWADWPRIVADEYQSERLLNWMRVGFYVAGVGVASIYVYRNQQCSLHLESRRISDFNAFLIRAVFWSVLLIGIVDMSLALIEVEQIMEDVFGKALALDLVRQKFRGQYIHLPLVVLALFIAGLTRSTGFAWLALLLVVVELLIVMLRYVFSYEQSYMSDLARFWYAALFLLATVDMLREGGHVRVDIFYSKFTPRAKSLVNALGALLLGMTFCWVILVIGTAGKFSIFNAALLSLEKTDTGYGMYVQYFMTILLAVYAILMLIQFVSLLFSAVAEYVDAS